MGLITKQINDGKQKQFTLRHLKMKKKKGNSEPIRAKSMSKIKREEERIWESHIGVQNATTSLTVKRITVRESWETTSLQETRESRLVTELVKSWHVDSDEVHEDRHEYVHCAHPLSQAVIAVD